MKHVTVVVRKGEDVSRRPKGDWAAFVGDTQQDVVRRGLEAARQWNVGRDESYVVYYGALTALVEVPTQFTLTPLPAKRARVDDFRIAGVNIVNGQAFPSSYIIQAPTKKKKAPAKRRRSK